MSAMVTRDEAAETLALLTRIREHLDSNNSNAESRVQPNRAADGPESHAIGSDAIDKSKHGSKFGLFNFRTNLTTACNSSTDITGQTNTINECSNNEILAELKSFRADLVSREQVRPSPGYTKEGCQTDAVKTEEAAVVSVTSTQTQIPPIATTDASTQTGPIELSMKQMMTWADANLRPTKRHAVAEAAEVLCKKYPDDEDARTCMRLILGNQMGKQNRVDTGGPAAAKREARKNFEPYFKGGKRRRLDA